MDLVFFGDGEFADYVAVDDIGDFGIIVSVHEVLEGFDGE